jgi:molybdopterin-dependent oxidoreductase alpha subunit
MAEQKKTDPLIETPVDEGVPHVGDQKHKAAGFPGVYAALKDAVVEMGVMRSAKTLLKLNQKGGFDCPSCAWPDPDDRRALAEFCENGAKAVADEGTTKRVTPEFFAKHSIVELSQMSDHELGKHGRLTHPMFKKSGGTHYEPIAWETAFDMVAEELNALSSPNEAAFYTSGRTSNEAAFMYQTYVRIFGTNNLPDCSNMCHESSGHALMEQIGIGKGTVTLEDFNHADCIIIAGQNPGTNHPRMLTALQKAARNGARIISINPLKEAGLESFMNPQEVGGMLGIGTPLSSLFLPVRINGDVAVAKGIIKCVLEAAEKNPAVLDRDFIARYTNGLEEFKADIKNESWDSIVGESGITREDIQKAADIFMSSKRAIVCWAMGLTQHKNAVGNIQMYTNLLLLGGHIGREGAGVCPVRGHSNVQGDRTMGIFEKIPEKFLVAMDTEFKFVSPRPHGFDTVATISAMNEGHVKVFFGMGGNFMSATPDTEYVAAGFKKCRLTVHVSTKPNRAHLITGDRALIFPCLGRTEIDTQASGTQFITVEDSMGVVHASHGHLRPGSPQLKSEVAIIAGLARATFRNQPEKLKLVNWNAIESNYDLIRDHIANVVPGCNEYNARVRKPGGFYLPNGPKDLRKFDTKTGKANFLVHPISKTRPVKGRYTLMTIRSHDQFNTTIYGLNDRYRGVTQGRRVIFMNRQDISDQGLQANSVVDITSHFGAQTRQAKHFIVVPYDIPKQCVAAYFPEANVLVPIGSTADYSNTPNYKSIEVSIAKSVDLASETTKAKGLAQ